MREAVGVFDVSHLGKALVAGRAPRRTSTRASPTTWAGSRPGRRSTRCAATSDRRRGRRPDRLPVIDDEVFLVPNAANTAEVVRRLAAAAPAGVEVRDQHDRARRPRGAGTALRRDAGALGLPTGHAYMSFARALDWAGCRRRGLPHRLHRRARLRAGAALGRHRRRCGTRCSRRASRRHPAAGLGARDTLRTEMGYPLHGQDLSLDITPVQARCGWAVGWKKPAFWGRDALLAERAAGPAAAVLGPRGARPGHPARAHDGARRRAARRSARSPAARSRRPASSGSRWRCSTRR